MNPSPTSQSAPLLALLGLVLVWGFSWIVMKSVLAYAAPLDFVALRYLGGAVLLLLVLVVRGKSLKPPPLGPTIAVGLCQTAGFQAFAQLALVSGGAGRVSLLAYTMPFWVLLLAWLLLGERPGRHQWAGLVLAAGGLVCVMQPWRGLGSIQGALLAVAGGLAWGLGTVLSKRMFQRHAPSPLALTAWQMLIGGLVLGAVALIVPAPPIDWTPAFIAGLAYATVLASSLAWLLWLFIVDRLPTHVAGLSALGVPVTVVLMAWLFLHERPDAVEVAGIVLIVLGLIAVSGIGYRCRAATRSG